MKHGQLEQECVAVIDEHTERSAGLVSRTGLAFGDSSTHDYTLQWIQNKLTLRYCKRNKRERSSNKQSIDTSIDFTAGRTLHRLKFGGGHGQAMARAVKTNNKPLICDATAGFGKDAFVFASLGCDVVLLERSIVVHALLQDAIQRAQEQTETQIIAERMHLHLADSSQLPANWPDSDLPQVVYLDPMYPKGKRTAKKEIQTLRALLDVTQDEGSLLNAARSTAQRVVVKRPRNAPPLADVQPSGNISSPNTRYDIYSGL